MSTGHMGDGSELTCHHSKPSSIPLQRFAKFLSLPRSRHDYATGGTSGGVDSVGGGAVGGVGRTAGVGGNGGTSGLAGGVASCTALKRSIVLGVSVCVVVVLAGRAAQGLACHGTALGLLRFCLTACDFTPPPGNALCVTGCVLGYG
ncbi:MAG: hypothetical protein ACK56W_07975, partial [Pirellula sp.]